MESLYLLLSRVLKAGSNQRGDSGGCCGTHNGVVGVAQRQVLVLAAHSRGRCRSKSTKYLTAEQEVTEEHLITESQA